MRVLLVNPPGGNEIVSNTPVALEESRGHNPPLGILFLAAYLERHAAHDIVVLDARAEELSFQDLARRIAAIDPEVVGITTMTQTLVDVLKVVEVVKTVAPMSRVVLGGPHVHLFPEETIRLPHVDFLVLGEGEAAFKELLDKMGDPVGLRGVPGLVFLDEGEVVYTGKPALIGDVDSLPFPARHLTDVRRYDSVLSPRHPVTTLFTSRGCPYACTFCDRPHLGKKFRARSPNNVVDEMEECSRLGIREFLFYDDTFTVRRRRVLDICLEILRRRLDVGWDVRARVDTVDPEMLRLMRRAGCRGIHYGVESGTPKILELLRKQIDLDTVRRVFAETRAAGMRVLAYFMIGCPTETRADILETFRVARALDPDLLHLAVLTPFPGTEIYRRGLAEGRFDGDPWRRFAARPDAGFVPPHWGENFTLEELNELLVLGYRSFYRRPGYLVRQLAAIRSPEELRRKVRAGIRILDMRGRDR